MVNFKNAQQEKDNKFDSNADFLDKRKAISGNRISEEEANKAQQFNNS